MRTTLDPAEKGSRPELKFIKAYHLLALLYLKRQEYEKARKLLKKAAYIDNTNTTTLRYLKEVELATGMSTSLETKHKKKYAREETVNRLTGATTYMSGNEMIIQPATFRESSAVATFLNICLGLILGGAIVWFLAVPATRQSVNASANKQVTDANTKMAQQVAQVQGLEDQIETYQIEVEEANKTRDDANKKVDSYDQLLKATQTYLSGDQSSAASQLTEVDGDSMTGEGEKLYTSLNTLLQDYVFNEAYNKAGTAYMAGDYASDHRVHQGGGKLGSLLDATIPGMVLPCNLGTRSTQIRPLKKHCRNSRRRLPKSSPTSPTPPQGQRPRRRRRMQTEIRLTRPRKQMPTGIRSTIDARGN